MLPLGNKKLPTRYIQTIFEKAGVKIRSFFERNDIVVVRDTIAMGMLWPWSINRIWTGNTINTKQDFWPICPAEIIISKIESITVKEKNAVTSWCCCSYILTVTRCFVANTRYAFFPATTRCWPYVGLMLAQRLRRWANITLAPCQDLVLGGLQLLALIVIHGAENDISWNVWSAKVHPVHKCLF